MKKEVKNKLDQMIKLFKDNSDSFISKEEIGRKIFSSDDIQTCRIIACGYLPEARRELEIHHNASLLNKRGVGWKITSGGLDTFKATQQVEKLMIAYKNSYQRKAKTFIQDKLPKSIRSQIKARNRLLESYDKLIDTQIDLTRSIEEGIAETENKLGEEVAET